jgi:hypothetical protein
MPATATESPARPSVKYNELLFSIVVFPTAAAVAAVAGIKTKKDKMDTPVNESCRISKQGLRTNVCFKNLYGFCQYLLQSTYKFILKWQNDLSS